jgi:sulfotransferase
MKINFISGLPRSGSTLLSSILNQNPNFHASITSPMLNLIRSSLEIMNAGNGLKTLHSEKTTKNVLDGLFLSYYNECNKSVVFDTNRLWNNLLYLYPKTKVICCVRSIPWILDSFELMRNKNPYTISTVFPNEVDLNVYTRCDALMQENGLVGSAYMALKTGITSPHSANLFLVDYEQLCQNPSGMMKAIYNFIEEPFFEHDFDNVAMEYEEYDAEVGLRGLHSIRRKVEYAPRRTCLPPDIWNKYSNLEVWNETVR